MKDNSSLAYHNSTFLDSDEGRPLRILSEYLHPMKMFQAEHVHDTVVFYGSARIKEDGPLASYYHDARLIARTITEWSMSSPCEARRFIVCSGGGGGIMEAANRGAADAGGRTIGLNIGLPNEQRPNPYITPGLDFEFHYFFMRKLWFVHLARVILVFPGGFGTMDELCGILTLSQTGKIARPISVLLYGKAYWQEIINFDALVRHGMISQDDVALFQFVDSTSEALNIMKGIFDLDTAPTTPDFAKTVTSCSPMHPCDVTGAPLNKSE